MDAAPRGHRRSIRLKSYDYTEPGMYFVTVCTQDRVRLFGEVSNGVMRLNDAGQMLSESWEALMRFPSATVDAYVVMPNHVHAILMIEPTESVGSLSSEDPGHPQGVPLRNPGQPVSASHQLEGPGHLEEVIPRDAGEPLTLIRDTLRTERSDLQIPSGPRLATDEPDDVGAPLVGALGAGGAVRLGDIVGAYKSMTTVYYVRGVKRSGWPPFYNRLWQRNYWEHVLRDDNALFRAREYVAYNPLRWQDDPENPARST